MSRAPAILSTTFALLVSSAASSAPLAKATEFDTSGSFCEVVWTDGEDRLVTGCNAMTIVHRRGARDPDYGGPRRPGQLDGLGRGAGIVLAAVTEDGTAARLEGGRWREGSPPDKDKLVAAAVDAHARTWFAGERALHLWQGEGRWTAFRYPGGTRVARAVRGDGGLYLAARDGALFHADGRGTFSSIPLPLKDWRGDAEVKGLWFSQGSRRLYLLRSAGLVVLDRRSGEVTTTRLPTWGTALTGFEAPGGEIVAIADARHLLGFHEGRLYQLAATTFHFSFVKQLSYNPRDGKLYIASQSGVFTLPLAPMTTVEGRATLARSGEAEARARGRSGITYPGRFSLLSAGLALGPSWNRVPGLETTSSFSLDLELGLRMPFAVVRGAMVALWPTVGYSFDSHDAAGGHRFVGGLGLGVFTRNLLFGATAASRFVGGSVGEGRAIGVRSGLRLELYLGLLGIDVAHQALYADRTLHGVRVTFGIDLVMWFRIFRFFSFLRSPSWSGAQDLYRAFRL